MKRHRSLTLSHSRRSKPIVPSFLLLKLQPPIHLITNRDNRGLWVNVASFDNYDEYDNFCQAIHADEPHGCEVMLQDYEGFPRLWYNEGRLSREDFDNILEYSEMCEKHDADAVDDFMELYDDSSNYEKTY